MRFKHLIVALSLVAAVPSLAFAHDVAKGANGGQVVDDKGHHVEFTTKGNDVVLYLSDEKNQPIASKGATGRVTVQMAGKQATATLVPSEPNVLTVKLDVPPASGTKIVVSAKLSDGHDIQARFVAK